MYLYLQNYRTTKYSSSSSWQSKNPDSMTFTGWKLSIFGVILVCIFPHLDWIRRDTLNTDTSPQERQLQIRTLFTQCFRKRKTFGFVRIFDWISCFLCPACWIVHESSRSETVESFWDSHLMSQPASDLSAIIINLLLFFSLVAGDVKEEMAISGSLSSRC